MPLQPLGNKILIKQKIQEEEVSKSGLILPKDPIEKKLPMGDVIAIGEKVESIKVGDKVVFEGWQAEPVNELIAGEKDVLIIGAEKIIAKVI